MISTSLKFVGNTPVYQLDNTNIFVKLEKYNLGGSVKDRAVLGMLEEAMSKGAVNKDTIIVEPTSGNTGIAVAILASVLGIKAVIIMPESMSIERRNIIKAYGAQLILTPKELGINKQIRLETLPAREGSYDEWLQTTFYANIIASASLLVSILALIFSRIPVKPYKSKIDEENQILDIESKKLDIENKRLEAEKRKVELEILKRQLSAINEEAARDSIEEINKKVSMLQDSFFEILSQNIYIKKHLSNFYKTLLDYPKITYISYSHYDINLNLIDKKRTVLKNQFNIIFI